MKQRFLHVWHGIDQTIIDNAIDERCGRLCACMQAKGEHLSNYCDNIQPYDKSRFSFCQMWHNFYIVFFWKLPQIQTSKFRKVVQQHTEGVVASIIRVLLEIYFFFQQCKNFENLLRIDKVIAMSMVYYLFWGTQCICIICITISICTVCRTHTT